MKSIVVRNAHNKLAGTHWHVLACVFLFSHCRYRQDWHEHVDAAEAAESAPAGTAHRQRYDVVASVRRSSQRVPCR